MNFNECLKLLNLDSNKVYDLKTIKKHYHFLALKYHPDKNNDTNSKVKFQEINKAYNYLYKIYTKYNILSNNENNKKNSENNNDKNSENNSDSNILNFDELLNDFLDLLNLKNNCEKDVICNYFKKKYNYYNSIIINKLSDNNYFKELFKNFYNKTKNNNSKENNKLIIINTDIENILNDEIYKLEINNEILYIPLWYREVVYDDYLIQIKINNSNDNFINIDNDNNIYIEVYSNINNLIDKNLYFNIGKKLYFIDNNLLYIKKINNYVLNNCGIINPIYHVEELQNLIENNYRSNIYVKLILNI